MRKLIFEIKNIQLKKTVISLLTVFFILIITPIILLTYIKSGINQDDGYTTVVTRLSIFFLGSIITMSVFVYNSKKNLSSNEFLGNNQAFIILLGIISSLYTLLSIPKEIYLPNFIDWGRLVNSDVEKSYIYLKSIAGAGIKINFDWSVYNILSISNLIMFLITSFIFISVLRSFLISFIIKDSIYTNYKKLLRIGDLYKLMNVKSTNLKIKLSKKQIIKIEKRIEIFHQNILYLLELKDSRLIHKYLIYWTNVVGNIQLIIFHSSLLNEIAKEKKELYEKTLNLTSSLVLNTSKDITFREDNIHLINSVINGLPVREQFFADKQNIEKFYGENYRFLSSKYYKELFNLFDQLYESSYNKSIYIMLLNNEVKFKEKLNQLQKQDGSGELNDITKKLSEDVFLSAMFSVINNKSEDLSVVLGLLFYTQNIIYKNKAVKESEHPSTDTFLKGNISLPKNYNLENKKEENRNKLNIWFWFFDKIKNVKSYFMAQKNITNTISDISIKTYTEENYNIILSTRIVKYIIIAITKACEIENYKAVGYLVKRLCNHVKWEEIEKVLEDIKMDLSKDTNIELETSILSLNPYSVNYCFEKAVFLLSLQVSYIYEYKFVPNTSKYVTSSNRRSIMDSLRDRKKDYGLSCIMDDSITKFEDESSSINIILMK